MIIKICGITNLEDARMAAECGADMLGFVFAESPRTISPQEAARIIRDLPEAILKVGVFVDENETNVEEIAGACDFDYVQLHGSETPEYVRRITVPVIKAFSVRDRDVLTRIPEYGLSTFILDSYDPHRAGGSGMVFDWNIAAEATNLGRMILAGGLNAENVAQAIRVARPYGVDVSSGVEVSPGRKDIDKIKRFVSEARQCACE